MLKDKYYTCSQAALVLDFTPDHIRRLILQGKIKAEKVGKTWIIKTGDLKNVKRMRSHGNGK